MTIFFTPEGVRAMNGAETVTPGFRIEELRSEEEVQKLSPQWDILIGETDRPALFVTHEWLMTWWGCHKSHHKKLFILACYDDETLIGIAPLMEIRTRYCGLPVIKLEFISMAGYAYLPTNSSGSLDFIMKRGREGEVIGAFIRHLAQVGGWNYLRLHPINTESSSIDHLRRESVMAGYQFHQRNVFSGAIIPVDRSWERYCAERGKDFGKRLRSLERKLSGLGKTECREYRSLGEINGGFDSVVDIERRSWKWERGMHIERKEYGQFYRRIAETAGKKGWLRLWILSIDGRPIAYDLSIEYRGTIVSLKSSYDLRYRSSSPGNLMTYRAFQKYFSEGVQSVNLLWGDLSAKKKWTSNFDFYDELFIFKDDIVSRCLFFLYHRLMLYRIVRSLTSRIDRLQWRLFRNRT